jgi:hypothetical protein
MKRRLLVFGALKTNSSMDRFLSFFCNIVLGRQKKKKERKNQLLLCSSRLDLTDDLKVEMFIFAQISIAGILQNHFAGKTIACHYCLTDRLPAH